MSKVFILVFIVLFLWPGAALGQNDLPEVLSSGVAVVDQNGNTFYGGMTGNYAVLNYDPNSSYGFARRADDYTFGLLNCYNGIPLATTVCFILGTGLTGEGVVARGKLMTSTTSIQNADGSFLPLYQLPVLYLGSINVSGDIFGPDLDNFAFWGRNLAQNPNSAVSPDTGASWRMGNYTLNPEAQSAWGNAEYGKQLDKVKVLASEGSAVNAVDLNVSNAGQNPNWYLQGSNIITDSLNSQSGQHPEGKIWVVEGDLRIKKNVITYRGKGTIIVKGGNLIVDDGVEIKPQNEKEDKLGFMVLK